MSITRGDFLRSLGKSLPGMVASTGIATAAEALIRRVAQASPSATARASQASAPPPSPPVTFYERVPAVGNQVALTFDDGPVPGVTEVILDVLRKRDLRATFFMIGRNVAAAPDLARRVLAEGHEIGNHTYSHSRLSELSDEAAGEELDRMEGVLADLLAYKAAWLRPPFGAFRRNQASLAARRELGIALWSLDSEDWRVAKSSQISHNILAKTTAGSIILCHELSQTAACLENILDGLQQRGFRLEVVSSLLKADAPDPI